MGTLKLISLPIGNLKDITIRAKEELIAAKVIFAEDTRNIIKLLNLYEIEFKDKRIESFHEHEQGKVSGIVDLIESLGEVCLVSDAGSPLVSDPAYPLIQEVLAREHEIETIPGVSSVIAALELSGLPPAPFHFHGFVPRENSKVNAFFESCQRVVGTHICFDSPYRSKKSIEVLCKTCPDVEIAVVREISKKFQSVSRFNSSSADLSEINFKGEFVYLFHIKSATKAVSTKKITELAENYLHSKSSKKNLSKLLAAILDANAKEVYDKLSNS